ncbi:hypothetical protein GcM3_179031 [Golovinomyces cichoracearum]|uniref:Uncharacterized protein n=1 Tax=Golovinomyces cichoracearum TaxID=62708 RepID=A0A420HN30_9PEZI|nr:hypothetical protein GcM3_179031 [Golovinomyces cichoracearum]
MYAVTDIHVIALTTEEAQRFLKKEPPQKFEQRLRAKGRSSVTDSRDFRDPQDSLPLIAFAWESYVSRALFHKLQRRLHLTLYHS